MHMSERDKVWTRFFSVFFQYHEEVKIGPAENQIIRT